jgi:hypothetical protein
MFLSPMTHLTLLVVSEIDVDRFVTVCRQGAVYVLQLCYLKDGAIGRMRYFGSRSAPF